MGLNRGGGDGEGGAAVGIGDADRGVTGDDEFVAPDIGGMVRGAGVVQ